MTMTERQTLAALLKAVQNTQLHEAFRLGMHELVCKANALYVPSFSDTVSAESAVSALRNFHTLAGQFLCAIDQSSAARTAEQPTSPAGADGVDQWGEGNPGDWYQRRGELCHGMIFRCHDDEVVRLNRGVPGDGTKWYVDSWHDGGWYGFDHTIEPSDLAAHLPG